ncbi:MAG: DUF4836 family protein [Prevotellaceae bacterium]|nr:DUF4836 family protein [Prevotellaceae bacterium]
MKTIKFLTITALCSMVIFGCSTKSAVPPHLVAVPKNAAVVLSLNARQIVEKAALNKPEQYQFYSLLQRELEKELGQETVNKFLKDTRTSGLNLDHVFAYLTVDGVTSDNTEPGFGVVFLMDDITTFEDFLKETGVYQESEKMNLQWNDKIAVISKSAADNGVDALNDDESKSILANELFSSEYSDKDDAFLFIDYGNFITKLLDNLSPYSGYMMSNLFATLDLYKELSLALTMNAEKGEFAVTGKMLPLEKATELFGKFYKTDFDSELYHYFPDKSLMAFKFAIKLLDSYNTYKKYLGDIYKDNLDIDTIMERYDAKITSVLSCFTGDFLGSSSDITSLDFAIAAGIHEGKENGLIAWVKELGFVKKTEGYYLLNKNGLKLYFATNNKAAYLTGNVANITNFLDNNHYTSNITDAKDFGKEFEKALCYFYWDININHYPQPVKNILQMTPQGNMLIPVLEKLKSINIQAINTNGSEFKIKFNENEYASRIVLKEIDKWASQSFFEE